MRHALDYGSQLPAQVVCILYAHVHSLPSFGGMRVDGVAGEEDSIVLG